MTGIPPHIQKLVEASEDAVESMRRSIEVAWFSEIVPNAIKRAEYLRDVLDSSTRLTEALRTFDAIANVTVKKAGS